MALRGPAHVARKCEANSAGRALLPNCLVACRALFFMHFRHRLCDQLSREAPRSSANTEHLETSTEELMVLPTPSALLHLMSETIIDILRLTAQQGGLHAAAGAPPPTGTPGSTSSTPRYAALLLPAKFHCTALLLGKEFGKCILHHTPKACGALRPTGQSNGPWCGARAVAQ